MQFYYFTIIYPEIKRHKEEKYFIVVIATYSKIMFVSAFSAIVHNLDLSLDAVMLCISYQALQLRKIVMSYQKFLTTHLLCA